MATHNVRSKLGFAPKLLHDVHEHLNPATAVEFAKRMEPFHLYFLEDILQPEQIDWFRNIRQVTTTPLAMGELFTNPREWLPLISGRLIDFIRCRISHTGGITQVKKIAAICEAFGVRTAWQEGGECDPVNQLAGYHVDISSAAVGIQEENHFPPLIHELMPGSAQIRRGYMYGNDKPGLGVDISEDLVRKYPLKAPPNGGPYGVDRALDGAVWRP